MSDALGNVSIGSFLFNPILPISENLPRQIFAGKPLSFNVFIDNSFQQPQSDLVLKVRMDDFSKNIIAEKIIPISEISANSNKSVSVDFAVSDKISGPHIMRLLLYRSNQMISQNYYYVSVTSQVFNQPIITQKTVMVWKPSTRDISQTLIVFDALKIKYEVASTQQLQNGHVQCDWLCIPAGAILEQKENNEWKRLIGPISKLVKQGMGLLVLEQFGQGDLGIAPGMNYLNMPGNVTADPVMFDHPVPAGVPWHKWWVWRGNNGDIAPFVMPAGMNSLIVIGAHADDRVYSILSEGTIGKGRVILSQADAVSRWAKDAAATLFLRELLNYALAENPWKRLQSWVGITRDYIVQDRNRLYCVDLKPYFNQSWSDLTPAGDKKGGWTDEGANDFHSFDPPRMSADFEQYQSSYAPHLCKKSWLLGLPFDIPTDGAMRKSCIVVGAQSPDLVKGISIACKAQQLFFLGTATNKGKGEFVIHYRNGRSVIVPACFPDWWMGMDNESARIAWEGINEKIHATVKCFIQSWENPDPDNEIQSLDFKGDHVVLLGLTVYRTEK
jgi:beta-galactosidase